MTSVGVTACCPTGQQSSRSFDDPDGHTWEVLWMDPKALEQSPVAEGASATA
jgi:uncharacterized protein